MKDNVRMIRIGYYVLITLLVIIATARIFSIEDVDNVMEAEESLPSFSLYLAYITLGLVILLCVGHFVYKLITDPKSQVDSIIGAVVVAAIFFIAKATIPAHFVGMKLADDTLVTASESTFSSAGLMTMYVIAGLAVLSAIATGIKALFE